MEEKFEKALTSKFKTLIQDHEEAYELGAWENFQSLSLKKKNNNLRVLWIGLAASFVMALTLPTIYNSVVHPAQSSAAFLTDQKSLQNASLVLNAGVGLTNNTPYEIKSPEAIEIDHVYQEATEGNQKIAAFTQASERLDPLADVTPKPFPGVHWVQVKYPHSLPEDVFKSRPVNDRKLKLSAVLSPSLNRGQAKLNFGGGFMVDMPLFKNLSLNTGLLVNNQHLTFKSSDNGATKTMKARLLGLELPVNLKYSLLKKKKKELYASAGVSSISYAKANFKEIYSNIEGNKISEVRLSSDRAFKNLEIAKVLNVAVGMEFSIEENLSVAIEPYVKYAIGAVTSHNIKSSSAGVHLKFSYQ